MSVTVAELVAILRADTSQFDAAMRRAGSGMSSLGSSAMRMGRTMTTHLTLPLVGIGYASTKMALDFDQSFRRINALAADTGMSVDQMKESVKGLAGRTAQDPRALAEALYFVASAGKDVAKNAMPILAASAKGAMVGMGDAATVAQLLTSVLHDYAGTGLNAARAMNILTGAVKAGKAEPADLAATLGTVIPVASQMGVSFQDVAAAIANATNAGVSAARAVTGLRFLIASFQNPTAAAISVFKDFGLSVGDIQNQLAQPGGLLTVIQGLADKFDLTTVAGKAAFATVVGGSRGAIIANTLVGNSAKAASQAFDDLATSAERGNTSFKDAQEIMNKTKSFRFAQALTELKLAAIDLGQTLIPILTHDILPAVRHVVDWFRNLSDGTKEMIVKIGLAAAAFGPLLLALGALLKLGGLIVGAVGGVVGAIGSIGGAIAGAGAGAAGGAAAAGAAAEAGSAAAGGASLGLIAGAAVSGFAAAALIAWKNTQNWNQEVGRMLDAFHTRSGAIDEARGKLDSYAAAVEKVRNGENKGAAMGSMFAAARTTGGGVGGTRETREAAEALDKYRHAMELIVRAHLTASDSGEKWTKSLLKNNAVTEQQAGRIATAVAAVNVFGGSLSKLARMQVENLLKVGDFSGALKVLRGAVTDASSALKNLPSQHQRAAGAAADQEQKVKALGARIRDLPKTAKTSISTPTDLSGLVALEGKLRAMGFVKAGSSWYSSAKFQVRVQGASPMPAVQIQQRIVDPLHAAGFNLVGDQWIARGTFGLKVMGGDGVGIYGGIVPNPAEEGERSGRHWTEGFVNGLLREATRLQGAGSRLRDVLKGALSADRAAIAAAKLPGADKAKLSGFEKADLDRVTAMIHKWGEATRQLEKLKSAFHDFRQSIKDGFTAFGDFASQFAQLISEHAAAMDAWKADQAAGGTGGVAEPGAIDFGAAIASQVAKAQELASLLTQAGAAGLSKDLLSQFAGLGADAIEPLKALLANPELIAQLNAASAAIKKAAGQTADTLGDQFFGKAIRQASRKVDRMGERMDELAQRLSQEVNPAVRDVARQLAHLASVISGITGAPVGGGGGGGGSGGGGGGGGGGGQGHPHQPHGGGGGSNPWDTGWGQGRATHIHGPVTVVANDPEDFYRKLETHAQRTGRRNAGVSGLG